MKTTKLKEILETEGIRQSELADVAGLSYSAVNKASRGDSIPSKTSQSLIIKGINGILDAEKYSINDIF